MDVRNSYQKPVLIELGTVEEQTLGADLQEPVEPSNVKFPETDM